MAGFTGINPYISSNDCLNFYATHDLKFAPGHTERMRIASAHRKRQYGLTGPKSMDREFELN